MATVGKTLERKFAAVVATLTVLLTTSTAPGVLPFAEARTSVPEAVLRKPIAVVENSVSTYVPSSVAPGNGIAVNVIYPEKPRYKAGAPIAIVVSGNESTSLSMSMHVANCGIAEVRFAYPGCGLPKFHSDGIFDNFGTNCNTAVKDVILFMKGETNDYKGRSIKELIPVSLDQSVVGLVPWETGANVALMTLAKHQSKIPFVSYLAFCEGTAGSMFWPDNLGTVKDMFLNRHYREGSAATGKILVDYRKLMYAPNAKKHPGVAKKRGEAEIPGVLFFDENNNRAWDETLEYALNYASEVGLDKQIYAPPIVEALMRNSVFLKSLGPLPDEGGKKKEGTTGDGKGPKDNKGATDGKGGKDAGDSKDDKQSKDDKAKKDKTDDAVKASSAKEKSKDVKAPVKVKDGDSKDGDADKKTAKTNEKEENLDNEGKPKRKRTFWELIRWPNHVAFPQECKAFYDERDGSLYIKQICETYPKLLVGLFGARIAHTQRQPDHPHITFLYNHFLESKPKWLRLNPEPIYVATICRMNVNNFPSNPPNSALDATAILEHLEPLGLVPEYAYMDALVAEMSDRAKSGNLKHPLPYMLSDYTPIPDPAKAEPKPEPKPEEKAETQSEGEPEGKTEVKPRSKTQAKPGSKPAAKR